MSNEPPILEGPRVRLCLALPDDVPAIVRYYTSNKAFLEPFDPTRPPEFYQEPLWLERVARDREDFRQRRALRMFLFERSHPETVIGSVNFNDVVAGVACFCNLGYGLAEAKQGAGLMREALELAIPYVFSRPFNLHRIQANYMPHNRPSGGLLRRLGFTVEGYARDYLLLNGRWEDHVLTSLTNPNWQPHYTT
jgi:ribosomal-protein-alanine N-acetyltransferase